jgi:UDP-N-acetylmuramoyl-tripeptide--D-alanyl-D-alanine ligase
LVHRVPENAKDLLNQVTIVQVQDTLIGMQLLANFWRHKMKARVLGLTGSNGKTTTKEFAAAIIGSRYDVHYSKGSLNNHWGVPMSLLAMDSEHEVAIIEMGMNHPGELTQLSEIAEPDVVVVTMVGRGHLEGLGSIEGVAKAKAEIYASAPKSAMMIFNLENEHTRKMYEQFGPKIDTSRIVTFAGFGSAKTSWPDLDVSFEVVSTLPEVMHIRGDIQGVHGETTVPVFGAHNVTNLMAAAALALTSGLTPAEIWQALPKCQTVWGRNQWVQLSSGTRVLFDGYNANPESMRAAIDNFTELKVTGRKFAILGEMKEMGDHAKAVHRELGEKVAGAGFDAVCFFGPSRAEFEAGLRSQGYTKSSFFSDSYEQSLASRMLPVLDGNDIVLMKGSRGMQLEKALLDMKPVDFKVKN